MPSSLPACLRLLVLFDSRPPQRLEKAFCQTAGGKPGMARGFQTMQTLSFILPVYFYPLQLAAGSVCSLFPCGSSQQPCLRNSTSPCPLALPTALWGLWVLALRSHTLQAPAKLSNAGTSTTVHTSLSFRAFILQRSLQELLPLPSLQVTARNHTQGVWMMLRHLSDCPQLFAPRPLSLFSASLYETSEREQS